ncbi:c-type cytochrome [Pseudoduganella namucuonensis]|uniref:Cytochrome c553 n=1 Tax=Pseudoduganella namucuonensis TaxID=1035707 RepID=A0A1I7M671_9BURK|nr:c-type cytochrome [Pseudoduganella namucuonensis]SFV17416.1 Cytochrome c553 [Pseudoduganella namucuonensis]
MLALGVALACGGVHAAQQKRPVAARAAAPALSRGDVAAGRVKAEAERCLECHAAPGEGQGYSAGEDGKFARLGGQQQDYIVKQIQDFRSGKRKHEFMAMMANSISDADLADIAAYFAAEPRTAGALHATAAPPAAGATPRGASGAIAERLYQHGDAARNVAACAACHGPAGQGAPGTGPVIGGQGRSYLSQQLHNWRSGVRSNSPDNTMNQAIAPLSDAEIDALAHYLSEM